jgi:hypothetical protein
MSRREWIVGALLALILVGGGLALLAAFGESAAPDRLPPGAVNRAGVSVGPAPSFAGQTAMVAYAAARNAALAWQPDAGLTSATATWRQGAQRQELLPGQNSWAFTFYAPTAGRTAVIAVVDGQARLVSEGPGSLAAAPLEATGWRVDSPAAVAALMAAGGDAFLGDNPVSTLVATLSLGGNHGRIEWFISLFGNHSDQSLSILLDATTGELLEIQ